MLDLDVFHNVSLYQGIQLLHSTGGLRARSIPKQDSKTKASASKGFYKEHSTDGQCRVTNPSYPILKDSPPSSMALSCITSGSVCFKGEENTFPDGASAINLVQRPQNLSSSALFKQEAILKQPKGKGHGPGP